MGQIAEDMIDGTCCSFCGQYFQDPDDADSCYTHGYPVACKECGKDVMRKPGTKRHGIQKAKVKVMGLILIAALLLSGCSMLEHTDKDGNTTRYFRCGPQQIDEALLRLPDGSELLFGGQKAELPTVTVTATSITVGGEEMP